VPLYSLVGLNRDLIDVEAKLMGASKKISLEEDNSEKNGMPARERPSAPEKVTVVGYVRLSFVLFCIYICFVFSFFVVSYS
jgi:hypothetical protein